MGCWLHSGDYRQEIFMAQDLGSKPETKTGVSISSADNVLSCVAVDGQDFFRPGTVLVLLASLPCECSYRLAVVFSFQILKCLFLLRHSMF